RNNPSMTQRQQTRGLREIIETAQDEAAWRGKTTVTAEDLLHSLLLRRQGLAVRMLRKAGISPDRLLSALLEQLPENVESPSAPEMGETADRCLARAAELADEQKAQWVG